MFKKNAVLKAGNYKDIYRLEDYDLWIRMLINNCNCYNIQEVLVYMRTNESFYKRRGGFENLRSHYILKRYMLENKRINIFEMILGIFMIFSRFVLPSHFKKTIYKTFLRK